MTFDVHFGSWLCENSSARRALRNISTGWARNCQSGLAQLGQYMTRVEAADAVVLDMSIRATVFSRTLAAFSGVGTASNRSRNQFAPTSSASSSISG